MSTQPDTFALQKAREQADADFMAAFSQMRSEHGWMLNRLRFFRSCLTKEWQHHAAIDLVKEITELLNKIDP